MMAPLNSYSLVIKLLITTLGVLIQNQPDQTFSKMFLFYSRTTAVSFIITQILLHSILSLSETKHDWLDIWLYKIMKIVKLLLAVHFIIVSN